MVCAKAAGAARTKSARRRMRPPSLANQRPARLLLMTLHCARRSDAPRRPRTFCRSLADKMSDALAERRRIFLLQQLGDLHRVGRRALAQVVGDDKHREAVWHREIGPDA